MLSSNPVDRPRGAVLCIGEAMALVVPTIPEPITVAESFKIEAGGAESNVASHLAAYGMKAEWFGAVGADSLGQRVLKRIGLAGVNTSRVIINEQALTGLYVKNPGNGVTYYRKGSAASMMSPSDLNYIDWSDVELLHLSGITLALSEGCHDLVFAAIDTARAHGIRVSFDVNFRPTLWPSADKAAETILKAASWASIVFTGRDEGETLWGCPSAADVRRIMPNVTHLIVKDADVKATEFHGSDVTDVPALEVRVVEPVGAGDAFAAGWIAAFLEQQDSVARLKNGHLFAAAALSSTSDTPNFE